TSSSGTSPSAPTTRADGSTWVAGRRRRAAAMPSPSRVCAFSRTSSVSSCSCQALRSTTGGVGTAVRGSAGRRMMLLLVQEGVHGGGERRVVHAMPLAGQALGARRRTGGGERIGPCADARVGAIAEQHSGRDLEVGEPLGIGAGQERQLMGERRGGPQDLLAV